MTNSKVAFVLGNARSRAGIDLQKLKDSGLLVGCNKIYTEIEPHIICALDQPMREEILALELSSSFLGSIARPYFDKEIQRDMVTRDLDYAYKNGVINLDNAMRHYPTCCYDSGVVALIVTSWIEDINTIYLLGFDFHHAGADPKNNNLYNEQMCKRPKSYENQINQVLSACNPQVDVIVVKKAGDDEFHDKLNIAGTISYEEFQTLI